MVIHFEISILESGRVQIFSSLALLGVELNCATHGRTDGRTDGRRFALYIMWDRIFFFSTNFFIMFFSSRNYVSCTDLWCRIQQNERFCGKYVVFFLKLKRCKGDHFLVSYESPTQSAFLNTKSRRIHQVRLLLWPRVVSKGFHDRFFCRIWGFRMDFIGSETIVGVDFRDF